MGVHKAEICHLKFICAQILSFYKIYQNSKKVCFQALKYVYPSLVYDLSAFQDILLNGLY